MSSYREYKEKALKDPEVKAEYDSLEAEYDIIQAMIDARINQHMTQKDLSAKTGITQADISRIENGTRNPSLAMVKRLAEGLGMQLKLELVPRAVKQQGGIIMSILFEDLKEGLQEAIDFEKGDGEAIVTDVEDKDNN